MHSPLGFAPSPAPAAMLARMARTGHDDGQKARPAQRGRPPARPDAGPRHANNIARIAEAKGWTQAMLAAAAGERQQTVSKLWRGERRLMPDKARVLAAALGCPPAVLYPDAAPGAAKVPETMVVASAFSETSPGAGGFDLPSPHEWHSARPGLDRPGQCFAATVADRSADGFYPPGSLLIARRAEALDRPLHAGDMVLVRRAAPGGATMEVLAGELIVTRDGELLLRVKSSDAEVDGAVVIRARPAGGGGVGDPAQAWARSREVAYAPEPGEAVEIVGLIEQKFTPGSR